MPGRSCYVIVPCIPQVATEGGLPASCFFAWAAGGIGQQAVHMLDHVAEDVPLTCKAKQPMRSTLQNICSAFGDVEDAWAVSPESPEILSGKAMSCLALSLSLSLSISVSLCLSLEFRLPWVRRKMLELRDRSKHKAMQNCASDYCAVATGQVKYNVSCQVVHQNICGQVRVQFDCLSSRCSHFYDEKNSCTKEMCPKNWFCFLPPGLDCNLAHRVYLMQTCTDNRCEKALHYIASRPLLLEHRTCLNTYRSRMWLLTWKTMSGSCGGPHSRAA